MKKETTDSRTSAQQAEFPPRSFPSSFVPSTILEQQLDALKNAKERGTVGQR
jgi:hypothetical protein